MIGASAQTGIALRQSGEFGELWALNSKENIKNAHRAQISIRIDVGLLIISTDQ
jgi:hypothetical protein